MNRRTTKSGHLGKHLPAVGVSLRAGYDERLSTGLSMLN